MSKFYTEKKKREKHEIMLSETGATSVVLLSGDAPDCDFFIMAAC